MRTCELVFNVPGHVILSLFVHSLPSFLVFPLVLVCSISPTACLRTGCPYHAASPPARLADPLCSPSTSSRPMASPACSRCTSSLRRDDYIQHGSDLDLGSFRCAFCTYKVRHDFPLQRVCALSSVSTNLSPLPHSFTRLSLPYFSSSRCLLSHCLSSLSPPLSLLHHRLGCRNLKARLEAKSYPIVALSSPSSLAASLALVSRRRCPSALTFLLSNFSVSSGSPLHLPTLALHHIASASPELFLTTFVSCLSPQLLILSPCIALFLSSRLAYYHYCRFHLSPLTAAFLPAASPVSAWFVAVSRICRSRLPSPLSHLPLVSTLSPHHVVLVHFFCYSS